MKKAYLVAIMLLMFSIPAIAVAQVPTPSSVPTLGPVIICSAGDVGTNVKILIIQNQSSLSNPIQLMFCVKAALIPYCYSSVGNIGYNLDGGTIYSVNEFINETIIHAGDVDAATVYANLALPLLSEGSHNATVYFGWQLGSYEVQAYSSVHFTVVNATDTSIYPSSSLSPSSLLSPTPLNSPTQQPSPTPFPTPIIDGASNLYFIILGVIFSAILIMAIVIWVHSKRRREAVS